MPREVSSSAESAGLPEMLRAFFWDCDFTQLTLATHRDFVVERVLTAGTWDAVCWLRRAVGDAALDAWLRRHRGGSLSPQQLRFWELILDLPTELVDEWLRSEERRIWEGRLRR